MGKLKMVLLACLLLPVLALGLEPPTDLILKDAPNDDGSTVLMTWKPSASENEPGFAGYNIERSEFPADSFSMIAWVPKGTDAH
ncbi:MAG: hypothetical protein Q7W05_10060, partial [Deltaproteobacteria bacterium]|nr:hypothetical protein [Deltaproteobacteria bacterium]